MRAVDLDTNGRIWVYNPDTHKIAHRGHQRTIYLGAQAQEAVQPFLTGLAVNDYLFSSKEAQDNRHAKAKVHRRPNQEQPARKTDRRLGNHYTPASYRRGIEYGCEAAKVLAWTPGRLRHNAATNIRREFGLEAAQIMLGHTRCDVTQVYAEVNHAKALKIASKVG